MKGSTLIITNLIILATGILLLAVFRHPNFVNTIIIITGLLFVIPGIVNMISLTRERKKSSDDPGRRSASSKIVSWITCCAALVLGATMIIIPEAYSTLFVYIFALTLAFGAIYHYFMMLKGLRSVKFPVWMYAFPTLILAAAASIFFIPVLTQTEGQSTVILLTGISLILFAVASFFEIYFVSRANKSAKLTAADVADASRQIEDVEAKEAK